MATTPAFPPEIFQSRRAEVLRRMREMAPGPSVAVFPATPVATRNNDVEYPYRADSDLFWLTGFEEPEAVAVLSTDGKPLTLFVRPRNREREIWNGRRAGVEGAKASFGADQAFTVDELDKELPPLLGSARTLYYRLGAVDPAFDARIARTLQALRMRSRAGAAAPPRMEDPGQIVHELRLHKSPEELRAMRKAVELTRKAHLAAMGAGRPGSHEYELQALLEHEFRGGGGRGWGYYPIVAAGANATVLHYNDNADPVREGELVLIDAGAEVDLYTADVTRTFPASGRATSISSSRTIRSGATTCTAPATGWDSTCTTPAITAARTEDRGSWSREWCSPLSTGCTWRRTTTRLPRSCAGWASASRTTSSSPRAATRT